MDMTSISGSYNSCFFCVFLLPRGLGKGCMAESWAWKHLVHVNATAEDVLNQRGWPAFVCIAVSCSSETWCLFRGLKNRVAMGTWRLGPRTQQYRLPFITAIVASAGTECPVHYLVPQMATHLQDQPANWSVSGFYFRSFCHGLLIWELELSFFFCTWICFFYLYHHLWDLLKII